MSSERDVLPKLRRAAPSEDAGTADIAASMRRLRDAGYLGATATRVPDLVRRLITVAEANLPVARLYEGHLNARRILATSASSAELTRSASSAILGVWGADGSHPLGLKDGIIVGGKRYASGLGVVTHAIVSHGSGDAIRLGLLDVRDRTRHRPGTWRMAGMRATASGDFLAEGLPAAALMTIGGPGDYLKEPGFIGGVWRIAAVQLGGTLGLLRAAADDLRRADRLAAAPQVARLAPLLTRALAAGALVAHAAEVAEGPTGLAEPEGAAARSAQIRLLTEEIGQDAIAAVERSVGLRHFDEASETGRIARDLATYMRQAARDALMQQSGLWMLSQDGPFSSLLPKTVGDAHG
jgi:hypothetical protein